MTRLPSSSFPSRALAWLLPSAAVVRVAIGIAAVLLCAWAEWGVPERVSFFGNEALRDVFVRAHATGAEDPRILVVDIDETSMQELGPWPWPRARIADLVEILLSRYEARGVALDILLPQTSDANGDARLRMLAGQGPLVLAQAFDFDLKNLRPEPLKSGVLAGALPAQPGRPAGVQATGYLGIHPMFAQAPHVGNIGFIPDNDGVLRRIPLLTRFGGRDYPALGLALVDCCTGKSTPLPVEPGLLRLSFQRDWSAFTVVSAADVLAERIVPEGASGRLVIVGSSSMSLTDRVATPYAASRPGLGVQAAVLADLLDRQAGRVPARWPGRLFALVFALAAALLATWAFPRLSAFASVGLLIALAGAWVVLAYVTAPHDPDFCTTGPLAANLFLLLLAVPFQWQLTQYRSRSLLNTLRQYVAPAVVQELLQSDLRDPLAPRLLDVTTLIADMEGYTSQVENLSMEAAAVLTREFLDCLTGPVIERGGTLDKYTGDGLVAFWGAPLPVERHADLALDAARAIVERVRALSRAREALGHPRLRVRIGIESGPAMAGDFGTSFRSIYTAVGDSVNTASRLEQAARDFEHDVIVGAGTVERAQRHRFLPLGERRLRGKGKATMLFTVIDGAPGIEAAPEAAAEAAPGLERPA